MLAFDPFPTLLICAVLKEFMDNRVSLKLRGFGNIRKIAEVSHLDIETVVFTDFMAIIGSNLQFYQLT
jgi:hypothetical protein